MQELLNRRYQELFVKLIESSDLCNSDDRRRTFLLEINLSTKQFRTEVVEHDFLVNLINHLVETQNQTALKLMLKKIRLFSSYDRSSLSRLENKLNLSGYVPAQPIGKPAYFVDSDQAFQLMPLDIGTIWGLQRSHFIGLLIGVEQTELYRNLKNVEFVLCQAVEEQQKIKKSAIKLPRREWIQLDIQHTVSLPFQKACLIDAALDLSSEVQACLEENTFPDAILPGFYFEVEGEQLNTDLSERIRKICGILLDQLFPGQSVAIVIHVIYPVEQFLSPVDGRAIENLKTQLQRSFLKTPVELMQIKTNLPMVNLTNPLFTVMGEMDTALNMLNRKFYLFSDALMDIWATTLNFDLVNIDFLQQALSCNQDFETTDDFKLEGVLLALLRNQQSLTIGSNSQKVQKILDELMSNSSSIKKVYDFQKCQDAQEDDFLSQNDPRQFTFAIRSNIEFKRAIHHFKDAPISCLPAPLCWLLSANAFCQNTITKLLLMDAKKRAIFGLCTQDEWQQIQKRQEKEGQVLDCRRKRSLVFVSACL